MRNICAFALLLLSTQCTAWKQGIVTVGGQRTSQALLTESVAGFMHVPGYTPGLTPGSTFVQLLPGYPVAEENLSFNKALGSALLSSPAELQKAYLFAKQVDGLLVLGKTAEPDGSVLSNYYLTTGNFTAARDGTSPATVRAMRLTSAVYNNGFFPTFLNPIQFLQDSSWTTLSQSATRVDTLLLAGKPLPIIVPSYRLSMQLFSLKVERPWFELSYLLPRAASGGRAFIDEVIFARNVKVENFANSQAQVVASKNGIQRKPVAYSPRETITIADMCIIGYVYRVL